MTTDVVKLLELEIGDLMSQLALDIHSQLEEDTPVDTGFAQSNWVPSVGQPFVGLAGNRFNAELGFLDYGPADNGRRELGEYRLANGQIFITNNVNYLELLNMGSSTQAPSMFVQRAIIKGIRRGLRNFRLRNGN